jgi:hypothetical protein
MEITVHVARCGLLPLAIIKFALLTISGAMFVNRRRLVCLKRFMTDVTESRQMVDESCKMLCWYTDLCSLILDFLGLNM